MKLKTNLQNTNLIEPTPSKSQVTGNKTERQNDKKQDEDENWDEIDIEPKLTPRQRRSKFMVKGSESFDEQHVADPTQFLKETSGLQRSTRLLARNFKQLDDQEAAEDKLKKRMKGLSPYRSAVFKLGSDDQMMPLEEKLAEEEYSQKSEYVDDTEYSY